MKRVPEQVTLKVEEKTWSIRLIGCIDRAAKLGSGWPAFAKENKLQVRNVCVFKMIKRTNIVFEVSIFSSRRSLGCADATNM